MNSFIRYVLWELQNSLGLVIPAGLLGILALLSAWLIHRKRCGKQTPFPWGKAFCALALAGYLAIVLYATVLRHSGGFRQWNLHLFRAWREAWNQFSVKLWANILLNVAMFVPMGILPQLLGKWPRKWYFGIGLGASVSILIELVQLASARGVWDIDDLFANTLGTAIGYFAVMTLLAFRREKGKRLRPALIYGTLALAPLVAIGSIFVAYSAKEYGNLPGAASYTNHTGGVEWNLECVLPDRNGTAAVYQTQTMDKAACDAFAENIASLVGQKVLLESYYEEMAYYNLDRGILTVNYYDGSYQFSINNGDAGQYQEADRETVARALLRYDIAVPEAAVFVPEGDGWYRFSCDRSIDDTILMDGTLQVRYDGKDTIWAIKNGLVRYTHYKEVEILSPEEAYQRLCAGKFGDDGFYEYIKPTNITVESCELDYEIDTKGFYQPVYLFTVSSPDGSYRDQIMIPART